MTLAQVEFRGRWTGTRKKDHKTVVTSYVSGKQPITDATVAGVLCHNQPCAYRRHQDAAGVTPEWLKKHVVPFIDHFYSHGAGIQNPALTLAYPLLWAAMSPEMENWMDPEQRKRIREEYAKIDTLPAGVNPVVRVGLSISQAKDILVIHEVAPEVQPAEAPVGAPGAPVPAATDQGVPPVRGVAAHATALASQGLDTKKVLDAMFTYHQQTVAMFNSQHQSHQATISNLREEMTVGFKKVDQHLCRCVVDLCL